MGTDLTRARSAVVEQRWSDAYEALESAPDGTLESADLERLAVCAYLLGEDDTCADAWQAAFAAAWDGSDPDTAARCGFWAAFCSMLRGQMASAGGWLARTERLIDEEELDCVASGYLLVPALVAALEQGDATRAGELAGRAVAVADRFDDTDLRAFATLGHGQALIAGGDLQEGTARLDEAMVAVTAGEVGPIASGIVYCAVILECMGVHDLQRASEWTNALSGWCDAQPDLVPYRGQCLVHRSQLHQAAGDWEAATETAAEARHRLTDPPHPALGQACYQQAELHRLRGELAEAEAAYEAASRHGYQPLPGLALLTLARGDGEAAAGTIRRALHDVLEPTMRTSVLAAAVEILLAVSDRDGARAAAEELDGLAKRSSAEVLQAVADQAVGAVLVAEGRPAEALPRLRGAAGTWAAQAMPYDGARSAVLVGRACAAMSDAASASLEWGNARSTFADLEAGPDLERLDALSGGQVPAGGGLSPREQEVLGHVAAGLTNPEIADELGISQHTVGRHLENIFVKLGVHSRAAATATAYEHGLL